MHDSRASTVPRAPEDNVCWHGDEVTRATDRAAHASEANEQAKVKHGVRERTVRVPETAPLEGLRNTCMTLIVWTNKLTHRHPQDNALTNTAAMIRAVWTHSLSGAGHLHTSPRLASVSNLLNLSGHMLHHNRRCHNKSQGNTSSVKSQSGPATVHYAVVRWDNNVVTVPFVGDEGRARALAARMTWIRDTQASRVCQKVQQLNMHSLNAVQCQRLLSTPHSAPYTSMVKCCCSHVVFNVAIIGSCFSKELAAE